jgi:hypothetical protein
MLIFLKGEIMINKIRIINKIGLLIVIIGFFMPISCNQNGFQLAEYMVKLEGNSFICGILLYVLFVSALLGVIIGFAILMKKKVNITYDWLLVLICIGSGLFVYYKMIDSVDMLQSGAYAIITG